MKITREMYDEQLSYIGGCCCDEIISFEYADGVCPECGSVTSGGEVVALCAYSPVECEVCGSAPCDGSC